MKRELARKAIHISGLLVPVACFQLDKFVLTGLLLACFAASAISEYLRLYHREFFLFKSTFKSLARRNELGSLSGYFYFFLGAFLTVVLFEHAVAATALVASILGDVVSAPVGLYFRRLRGIRGKRTLEGSLAGALVILSLLPAGLLPSSWIVIASMVFMVADLLKPKGIDDNLLFPLIIGAAIHLYTTIFPPTFPTLIRYG
ncbi:MAG: hypothetical protein N3H31_01110 [Candidatus Nezhaarchaeota archaeon]|nr:hypothetical protein [Candidatus Nezhaarchaeota archaeon]